MRKCDVEEIPKIYASKCEKAKDSPTLVKSYEFDLDNF